MNRQQLAINNDRNNLVPGTQVQIFNARELSVIGKIVSRLGVDVTPQTNERMNNILKLMLVYGFLLMMLTAALAGGTYAANMKLRGAYDHKHQVTLLQYLAALTPMLLKVTETISAMGAAGGAAVGVMVGVMEQRATEFFTMPANSMKERFNRLIAKPGVGNAVAAGHGAMAGAGLAMAAETAAGSMSNVSYFLKRGVGGVGGAITSKMPDFATVLSKVASDRKYAERILVSANAATGRMVSGGLIKIMVALYGYALTLCNNIGMRVGEVIIMSLVRRFNRMRIENEQQLLEDATGMAIRGPRGGGNRAVRRLGAPGNINNRNQEAVETLLGMAGED
jgi:hypothetical protein